MDARTRAATDLDLVPLTALAALTFPLACPPGADPVAVQRHVETELGIDPMAAWIRSPRHELYVVERDGVHGLLGYALMSLGPCPVLDTAGRPLADVELSKIYVHPDAQGAGVASTLLMSALTAGRRLATGPVWLGTNQENHRAQSFYARGGFDVVGHREYVVGGETHQDVVMVRDDGSPTRLD
ncbi:GNAT family N-acetyltransferase [Paraoerskovia marina]|uniref:GNAT family N-acetyltransferase n=1 Tax=Paraoerskovia marina TaxID=545619 RepID=UPI00069390DE|nr:GNAT family N-acetyltransferase [Paraoerskovia marina]